MATAEQTRREFLETASAGVVLAGGLAQSATARVEQGSDPVTEATEFLVSQLRINGVEHALPLDPRSTLLDVLRERLALTGTKKGCDHGQCGACTIHVDGRRVLACLTLAVTAQGKEIGTVEGLGGGGEGELHPLQAAFIAHDAFQCGYCTPGQLMAAAALLDEPCGPADADVREALSGNLCRCGAYPNIVAAVQEVRAAAPREPEAR